MRGRSHCASGDKPFLYRLSHRFHNEAGRVWLLGRVSLPELAAIGVATQRVPNTVAPSHAACNVCVAGHALHAAPAMARPALSHVVPVAPQLFHSPIRIAFSHVPARLSRAPPAQTQWDPLPLYPIPV